MHRAIFKMSLILSIFSQSLLAENSELFDLNLSDLANLKVNIASSEPERIVDTPAVVTSYNVDAMQNLGLNTLEDVLNFVPGVVVQDTAIGTKAVMIRGIVEAFNQKVLFLLDGTPYWQPAHGGNPMLAMPFTYIEKVEVIRGPGAVIYGSNASGGVINVITKQSSPNHVDIAYDSLSSSFVGFYYQKKYSDIDLRFGAHDFNQDGYQGRFNNRPIPPIFPSDTASDITLNKQQQSQSVWFALKGNHWKFSSHYFESENKGLAAAASTLNLATLKYTGTLIQAEMNRNTPWGYLKAGADVNNFYLTIPTKNLLGFNADGTQQFEDQGNKNNRYRVIANLNSPVSDSINWLNGFEIEQRQTGDYQNVDDSGQVISTSMEANETQEVATYTQVDISQGSSRWVIGGRYVDNELAGEDWLMRMSYVYTLDRNQSVKVLYSEGFNAPTFVQQFIEIPPNVVKGNEDIRAEKVKTWEMVYTLQSRHHFFVANIYRLWAEDFIFRDENEIGIIEFANTQDFTREGLDLDYRFRQNTLEVFANLSWAQQGNSTIEADNTALFVPRYTTNLGASINMDHSLSVGAGWLHISERESAHSINLVNANVTYQESNRKLSVYVENVLQDDVNHPDVQNFSENRLVPAKSPHSILGMRLTFDF